MQINSFADNVVLSYSESFKAKLRQCENPDNNNIQIGAIVRRSGT